MCGGGLLNSVGLNSVGLLKKNKVRPTGKGLNLPPFPSHGLMFETNRDRRDERDEHPPPMAKRKATPITQSAHSGRFFFVLDTSRLRQGLSKGSRLSRLSSNNYAREGENLSKLDMSTTRACDACGRTFDKNAQKHEKT